MVPSHRCFGRPPTHTVHGAPLADEIGVPFLEALESIPSPLLKTTKPKEGTSSFENLPYTFQFPPVGSLSLVYMILPQNIHYFTNSSNPEYTHTSLPERFMQIMFHSEHFFLTLGTVAFTEEMGHPPEGSCLTEHSDKFA